MTGIVHSLFGAAAGSLCNSKSGAFASGVISHLVADLIPHRDIDPRIDVPLASVVILGIAQKYGPQSEEFLGALAGVLPDIEHAAAYLGLGKKVFYTHIDDGKYHARETKTCLSQYLLAGAALLMLRYSEKK